MNIFKRTASFFSASRDDALAALRGAEVVARNETGMRIDGCNAYQWVFCSSKAVVHTAEFSRAARFVHDTMAGHKPEVSISDRYSAQQGHGQRHPTCLAHVDRKARFTAENGSDFTGMRIQLWFDRTFRLARDNTTLTAAMVKTEVVRRYATSMPSSQPPPIVRWRANCSAKSAARG